MHRIDEQSTIEITNNAYYIIFHYTNIAHKSHFLIPTMWKTNYRLNPKLPMPNFLNHSTAYPAVNISVSRRDRDTQSFCNLQVGWRVNVVSSGREVRNCCCREEKRWPGWVSST